MAFFAANRAKIVECFKNNQLETGTIFYESPVRCTERFNDTELRFYQDPLFHWLTGWPDPDAAIVIDIASGNSTFFMPDYPDSYETWTGPIPTIESIQNLTGAAAIRSLSELPTFLSELPAGPIYSAGDFATAAAPTDTSALLVAAAASRVVKTPYEIETLRTACDLSGKAIIDLLKWFQWTPEISELAVQARFEFIGATLGCRDVSFQTIAAAGANASYLHYVENAAPIRATDMILLDCGLRYQNYCGDITRCFPASGKFSPVQKQVYNALLRRQCALIELVKPGLGVLDLYNAFVDATCDVAKELGLIKGEPEKKARLGYFFCPHGVSHSLGIYCHDGCSGVDKDNTAIPLEVGRAATIVPGMVITIEPGIYFRIGALRALSEEDEDFPFIDVQRALELAAEVGGIRIEDDVLVTETGCEVLTRGCPKTVEEIEALMKRQ